MLDHYGKHRFEPAWRPTACLRHSVVSARLRSWLLDPHSLTRRLQQTCPGRFSVEVVRESFAAPMLNEARVLGYPRRAWIREVRLLCDGVPWVYARTVIPHATLTGPQRRLRHLGNRPLGAMLFKEPGLRRDPLQVAALTPRHALYHRAAIAADDQTVWGRRSIFYLEGKPLLVSELFLPQLPGAEGCR